MTQSSAPHASSLLAQLARLGQAAWMFGNLYEAAVGLPQLLSIARAERRPGLFRVGSPVRYFAPVSPLAVGASAVDLVRAWRSRDNRGLVLTSAAGLAAAVGLSGYLIHTVNIPLLSAGDLGPDERERLVRTWYRANTVRVAALTAAMGSNWLRSR